MRRKKTPEHKKKLSAAMQKRWSDPKWRAMMVEKQKRNGMRLQAIE